MARPAHLRDIHDDVWAAFEISCEVNGIGPTWEDQQFDWPTWYDRYLLMHSRVSDSIWRLFIQYCTAHGVGPSWSERSKYWTTWYAGYNSGYYVGRDGK